MKTALATLSAIALVATPIYVANAAQTKSTTATKSVAKQAKAEGESTKTEAKEARHHSTKAKATKSVAAQAKAEGESVKTEAKEIRHHAAMKHHAKHHRMASKSKMKAKTGTSKTKTGAKG
jgi:hypothetical protein